MTRSGDHPLHGAVDVARLAGFLAASGLRRRRMKPALHDWVRARSARGESADVTLGLLGRRLMLVNDADLSARILAPPPRTEGIAGGKLRGWAMSVLAPQALTISNDDAWERRRAQNDRVLDAAHVPEARRAYLDAVEAAFATPAGSAEAIRERMGRVMLAVVFGDSMPADLPDQVRALMGVVKSLPRRRLAGRRYAARRARFYGEVRRGWDRAGDLSLVGRFRALGVPPSSEALEQIPHWMFTFVLSGTDLLTRALAMIGSRPDAWNRVRDEVGAAGPLDEAAVDRLPYLTACIREAGRLFAPVTSTSHSVPRGADLDGRHLPARTGIVHYFPLMQRNTALDPTADRFLPQRWLDPGSGAGDRYPDLFLSGARRCPGRDLIMFVCTSAIAIQVGRLGVRVESPALAADPLPLSFPSEPLRFHLPPSQEEGDQMPEARAGRSYPDLLAMSQRELDALYRDVQEPGPAPVGDTLGTALLFPGRAVGGPLRKLAHLLLWQGKVFDPARGTLRNKLTPFGVRAVRARVYTGDSWLDRGSQATVLDYSRTSLVARWIRDEIREVSRGLWLGKVFVGRWHVLDFTLRAR